MNFQYYSGRIVLAFDCASPIVEHIFYSQECRLTLPNIEGQWGYSTIGHL